MNALITLVILFCVVLDAAASALRGAVRQAGPAVAVALNRKRTEIRHAWRVVVPETPPPVPQATTGVPVVNVQPAPVVRESNVASMVAAML